MAAVPESWTALVRRLPPRLPRLLRPCSVSSVVELGGEREVSTLAASLRYLMVQRENSMLAFFLLVFLPVLGVFVWMAMKRETSMLAVSLMMIVMMKFDMALRVVAALALDIWLRTVARSLRESSRCSLERWSTPAVNYLWVQWVSWGQTLWVLRGVRRCQPALRDD